MLNRNQSLEREPRTYRKRPLPALDTALRCSVPLGPVIVSAEEVRKSQAAKAAQATLAAEVKRSGAEPAFQWLHKSDDSRSVDALLQRLMNIGADETERSAELLPSLG